MSPEVKKLIAQYMKHKNIIIGVDFDDTIFALSDNEFTASEVDATIEVLIGAQRFGTVCLWTVADEYSLKYKIWIAKKLGICVEYVNESPVKIHENCKKPYFNILLDDSAGLPYSREILREFNEHMEKNRHIYEKIT